MPPTKKHIMDKQEQSAAAAAGPQQEQTPQLHDHAQVLQEAASALKSLHDGESSESSSPAASKRASAVAPTKTANAADASSTTTGGALQAAVEAAFASTSAASSSKKNKATSDGSSDANADWGSNPKKSKQIDGTYADTATGGQFDEEIPLTFPQRLMEVLDDEGNDDIIGWLPHGRGFLIYQKRRFAAELMGKYFKQSKFTSFTRKLNRWGFTRISRGPETGAYYHPFFRKGNARLCLQMTCQSHKSGPNAAGTITGAAAGAKATVTTNTAPASMLQHREASTAAAQLAVPKAAKMQQSLQQQPIAPAPGLPSPPPMAAALVPNATTTGLSSAELLRTETATESVLRLRQLHRQQEQLMIRQRQIREEIQAISAALPEKIAQERRHQQVKVAAASSTAVATATAAGQMPSATPNATPATQATPPSGSTGSGTAPAPSATAQGQNPAYSKAIVDAAIETLKRSNANSYLTLLMARQQQQQQQQQQGAKPVPPGAMAQAGAVSGPIAPAPAMATPAAATPATAAAANAPPTAFQSQLRQTLRAQLDQMRLAESQRRQQPVQPVQQAQQAQQMNQAMEGITLTDDSRFKAGLGALHPAQAAAQSGTYRSGSQGQKRPSGAKRASAA